MNKDGEMDVFDSWFDFVFVFYILNFLVVDITHKKN